MRKTVFTIFMAGAMVVGVVPVTAGTSTGASVGKFFATMDVGEYYTNGSCDSRGGPVDLGVDNHAEFPALSATPSHHVYTLRTAGWDVTSLPHGAGTAWLCGEIGSESTGLGGISNCASYLPRGYNGQGILDFGTTKLFISGFGWEPTAGSYLIGTGSVGGEEGVGPDQLIALLEVQGRLLADLACPQQVRREPKSHLVRADFTVVPNEARSERPFKHHEPTP